MEQFSDDFSNIINDAAQLMFNQNQKKLTALHICYSFFNNNDINQISNKYINDLDSFKKELISITESYDNKLCEPDLSEESKQLLHYCITKLSNQNSSENIKIDSFDFIEALIEKNNESNLFERHGITIENLNKIKSSYKKRMIKITIKKTKMRQGLNDNKKVTDEKLIEDKNDIRNFITDLSEKVKNEKPLVFDFDNKIDELINVLLRKEKSNPLLIGYPGVGKSILVEGLALAINSRKVPEKLKNKKIIELNLTTLVSGTNFRGDFEKRFENIIKYLEEQKNVIVFIDEIHCMKGLGSTGSSKGELDFSNMIKPYLSSGSISCIGATTFDEYKNSIEKDKALDRRFKTIQLKEPSVDVTKEILLHKKKIYENYHGTKITKENLFNLVDLTERFITKGHFPDKAFDVLDMSMSSAQKENLNNVSIDLIIETISNISNIDKDQIKGQDSAIINLENELRKRIFGQNEAIKSISEKLLIAKTGFSNPLKPLASFLLIGTTGVGKTEVVNELSKQMSMEFLRLDMSEYSEKGSISKLIGTSAGYVGYEDGGKLTDFVIRNPHAVILLDEIEKADRSVYNLFLQILDYGKITDGMGRSIDFRNTIIFFTSNAGVQELSTSNIGFTNSNTYNLDKFEKAVTKTFSPEFLNRISKIVTFEKLNKDSMYLLVNKNLNLLKLKLKSKEIEVEFTNAVIEAIVKNGFNEKMGARPLERYVEDNVTFLIAKNIIQKKMKSKLKYKLDFINNEFILVK